MLGSDVYDLSRDARGNTLSPEILYPFCPTCGRLTILTQTWSCFDESNRPTATVAGAPVT